MRASCRLIEPVEAHPHASPAVVKRSRELILALFDIFDVCYMFKFCPAVAQMSHIIGAAAAFVFSSVYSLTGFLCPNVSKLLLI